MLIGGNTSRVGRNCGKRYKQNFLAMQQNARKIDSLPKNVTSTYFATLKTTTFGV